jgi:hypothetical protein
MRNVLLVWGKPVAKLFTGRVQSFQFSTPRSREAVISDRSGSGFTSPFPTFYQLLSPAIFGVFNPFLSPFYPLSTPPNNNKTFINLFTYY